MCEPVLPKESDKNDDQNEKLFGERFEYAWRYFEFHAKQRTTMFSFFLVFSAFIIGACAKLLGEKQEMLVLLILGMGMVITIFFIFLDRRNEELVHIAEDVLNQLEEDYLFKNYKFKEVKYKIRTFWGVLKKPTEVPARVGILNRRIIDDSRNKHGTYLPAIQFLIFVMYFTILICLLCPRLGDFVQFLEKLFTCMKG